MSEFINPCRSCRKVEVPDHTWDCPTCVGGVRQDLIAIVDLYATLPEEAEHRGVNSEALVLLGPTANPEARGHLEASVAAGRITADMLEDGNGSHPLLTLANLAMIVRDSLGHDEFDGRATVAGESSYLQSQLTTLSHDGWFDFPDMRRSLKRCRAHLEAVLHAGEQVIRGGTCPGNHYEGSAPRLIKIFRENDPTGSSDQWECPGCHEKFTNADYDRKATAQWWSTQRVEINGEVWCSVRYAATIVGRTEGSINGWVKHSRDERSAADVAHPVPAVCVIDGRRRGFVSLDAVQARHEAAGTRRSAAA